MSDIRSPRLFCKGFNSSRTNVHQEEKPPEVELEVGVKGRRGGCGGDGIGG